jgi:DTW domain-containing protein YfiP
MKKQEYLARKAWQIDPVQTSRRGLCPRCLHAPLTCFCAQLKPFDPKIKFVILIHGREAQKKIATGRMAHLCLENSELIPGYDYSENTRVNAILQDPENECVVLYPGSSSANLSEFSPSARRERFAVNKRLVIFVIDGTWITARKTMQRSANLASLPRICFVPATLSRFRVRKQPGEICFSTIEAIHQTIELLKDARGLSGRPHDSLLRLFEAVINQQIELSSQPKLYCLWKAPLKP